MKKYFGLLLVMMLVFTGCDTKKDDVAGNQGSQNIPSNETDNPNVICRRATTLHTETCSQTHSLYNCSGAGYSNDSTITYGSLGTSGILTSGDAFDCDVNGDGTFDATTERFYYITDLSSNNNYAVLIYYNNTTKGVADNTSSSLIAYHSSDYNYEGPVTAVANLPTTTQWSNISLASKNRQITNESGGTTTSGETLPTFSYSGYAARLITAQEINSACGITVGSYTTGELDSCNYLMENTKFSSRSMGTSGYWLETSSASDSNNVWNVSCNSRFVDDYSYANRASSNGVRPVIEVLKSNISY